MAIFTAAAAAIASVATAIGFSAVTAAAIGSFVVKTLVTVGISRLIANRAMNKMGAGAQDAGARIQLAPATNNKLPVVYGSAFIAPTITDAKISTDQKTMWYVCALCEKTSGTISFGDIYYDGKLVTFDGTDQTKVISLTTNSDPVQVDTKIAGNIFIYKYNNGSSSGVNTAQTAIQVLQDAAIPANDRWTSTDTMTNTAFVIVKVIYNRDADTINLGQMSIEVTNTLTKPGAVLLDYMQDSVYGCAIPAGQIETASFTALDTYSDQTITYLPVNYPTVPAATQPRYRINGPVNVGDTCLNNLQQLADSCDSWLQYSELTGKWKVVINKPYTGVITDLYHVDSSVLIGGIDINPLDLNQTYNSLEVQYPDANIKDQTNYKVVDMTTVGTSWYDPTLLSPNEPDNRLVVQYPQVNNYVQAVYLGVRRLLQSREDLTITCNLDYSGIQVEAGDVVRVTIAEYGWTNKLFRVSQVQETKTPDGFLGARITAFEYNGTIYNDNAIQDYVPEDNTGLTDPAIIGTPNAPTVTLNVANSIAQMTVAGTVPSTGQVLYMDFNAGTSNNSATHQFITRASQSNGAPYASGTVVTINNTDLPANTYYWSVSARNELAASRSNSSNSVTWAGPTVTSANTTTICNASSSGNLVTLTTTTGIQANANVLVTSGTGAIPANTYVANINSANTFTLSATPTTPLSNACLSFTTGGISGGNSVQPGSITYINLGTGTGGSQLLATRFYRIDRVSNVYTAPINGTTANLLNSTPIYLDGNDPGVNYYMPSYSATSTTANGYYAASTSMFQPADAAYGQFSIGDNGWYIVGGTTTGGYTFAPSEKAQLRVIAQFVANVDCTIQLNVISSDASTQPDFFYGDNNTQTIYLKAATPQEYEFFQTYSTGGASIDRYAIAIRNLTNSSRVYCTSFDLELYTFK